MLILKAENTEKADHTVKARLPGKMCTLTSIVWSQHAIGQTRLQRKSIYHVPVLVNKVRPTVGVFIQRKGFVFYRTLLYTTGAAIS